MKLRIAILFSLTPWLIYFAGEKTGHMAAGSGSALFFMLICQGLGWYRLKWTDWTQTLYFALVFLASIGSLPHPLLDQRSLLAPGLFLMMTLGSLVVGHPFTNQFAREQIPDFFWNDPMFPYHFARVNRILTIAWGLNFGLALMGACLMYREEPGHFWLVRGFVISSFVAVAALTRFFPPWYEAHVYRPLPLDDSETRT